MYRVTLCNILMILIYCPSPQISRLYFISEHIFGSLMGSDFEITADRQRFLKSTNARINYSDEKISNALWIVPHGLLSENGHRTIDRLNETSWNGMFAFFGCNRGDLPFDIFAASFYLLTSYEEYYSDKLDQHGRFDHTASLLFQHGLLETPIIDRWAEKLRQHINRLYPKERFHPRKFRLINTFDIDFPYRYRYKGLVKNLAGIGRDLLHADFKQIHERILVCLRRKDDPYFAAIRFIDAYHEKKDIRYHLFVLLGTIGKYGRSTIYPTPLYHRMLPKLGSANVGLHPSYTSLNKPQIMPKEKKQLEQIMNHSPITSLRRHFLRYTCPDSFREAVEAGFTDDFSLAFSNVPGFRSGTAVPYWFYDVARDQVNPLTIHPTVVMDTTLILHQQMRPEDALEKIRSLACECQRSGGDFTILWHNSNLAGDARQNPWIYVFQRICQFAETL